jgi:CubicO group peptidase (beta-lactamase class C family)
LILLCTLQSAAEDQAPRRPVIPGIGQRMQSFVDDQEIAGAVTLVTSPEREIHFECTGWADIESHRPMRPDTLFWIASMTKPITGAAVCLLEERGLLSLSDPVEKFIPEFSQLKNPAGEHVSVSLMQVLTHTSGMADFPPEKTIDIPNLAGLMPLYVSQPVKFPPGSKWQYCQSGINTAGRIVEIVSNLPFDEFLRQEIFEPLQMKDTAFSLSDAQMRRLATSYKRNDDGTLEPTPIKFLAGKSPTSRDRFPAPNGGLFSTAEDYARFCRMLLNRGAVGDRQLLKPATVARMTSIQTAPDIVTGFTPGNGWGVATCVVREPQGITEHVSPGTFGHGGAYGTQAWVDPQKKLAWILMVQRANFKNSDASPVRAGFQEALFASPLPSHQ